MLGAPNIGGGSQETPKGLQESPLGLIWAFLAAPAGLLEDPDASGGANCSQKAPKTDAKGTQIGSQNATQKDNLLRRSSDTNFS